MAAMLPTSNEATTAMSLTITAASRKLRPCIPPDGVDAAAFRDDAESVSSAHHGAVDDEFLVLAEYDADNGHGAG
ncbi:hypothetical protein ACFWIO_05765 [Streptomyces diastatochromogenes]|uniref:hypothetical protein n=1 Tax=Streptomyces diastatochromogenes TaxID=42236 RepID=UPI0036565404